MLVLDAALVSADEPSLKQRGDKVNARQNFVGWIGPVANNGDLMPIASGREAAIAAPAIGMDRRPRLDGALNKRQQAVSPTRP